jgi:hypothetical protein
MGWSGKINTKGEGMKELVSSLVAVALPLRMSPMAVLALLQRRVK